MKGMIIGEESEADTGDERARGIKGALSTTRNVVVELGQGRVLHAGCDLG